MADASTGTQAVDRAAHLVSTVVHADEPLTFADLQESSGLAKSTTSRMLSALERGGLARARRRRLLRRGQHVLAVRRAARPVGGAGPAGPAGHGADRRADPRDRAPLGHPRREGRPGGPGRLPASCSAPATGPRSRSRPTRPRSARSSTRGGRCRSRDELERLTDATIVEPDDAAPRRHPHPQARLGRHQRRARGRADRRRRTCPGPPRRRGRGPRHLGTHPATGGPARRARSQPVVPSHAALQPAARPYPGASPITKEGVA